MVLIWFDLSNQDGEVSHVVAYVIRRLRGQSVLLVVFYGCAIRFFLGELQRPYTDWLYPEDSSPTD